MKQKKTLAILILLFALSSINEGYAAGNDPNMPTVKAPEQPYSNSETDEEENGDLENPKIVKDSILKNYGTILKKYVDKEGCVDYRNLRKKRAELLPILRELKQLHPAEMLSWSKEEKIAFWINTHNIFTIKLVIDNYPIKPKWYMIIFPDNSIIHIPGGRNKKYFEVMGLEYTLEEIEKEALMNRFKEPLIAFGLSYATMGGAYLLDEPYTSKKLYNQLKNQARKMLSDKRGIRIDQENNVVYLTDIFNWYEEQFIEKYGAIKRFRDKEPNIRSYLNFILEFAPKETVNYLTTKEYTVKFQNYDWLLNEQTKN
ncbi:MAG: DUF547 domain-containing protein [Sedimentisphaerales bacterium]|nr:DUF547 domain-containing protein [Sedimentisphaerales bacterium]